MYSHILIPTDGSELATRAVEHGVGLARAVGARVTVVTVTEPFHVFSLSADQLEDTRPEFERHMKERAERILAEAGQVASRAGIGFGVLHREADQPHAVVVEIAEGDGCDLIVMGSHGRRGISALVLGSVTMKVLAHTGKPVLVVR